MLDCWLFTVAGLHVPVILLSDVVGKDGTVPPSQIVSEVPNWNVGVMFWFTVTVKVAVVAHCPAEGVKVYVPDAVLLTTAGLHAPVMPLLEMDANVGTETPEQIVKVVPKLNEGVAFCVTVTVKVAGKAH